MNRPRQPLFAALLLAALACSAAAGATQRCPARQRAHLALEPWRQELRAAATPGQISRLLSLLRLSPPPALPDCSASRVLGVDRFTANLSGPESADQVVQVRMRSSCCLETEGTASVSFWDVRDDRLVRMLSLVYRRWGADGESTRAIEVADKDSFPKKIYSCEAGERPAMPVNPSRRARRPRLSQSSNTNMRRSSEAAAIASVADQKAS